MGPQTTAPESSCQADSREGGHQGGNATNYTLPDRPQRGHFYLALYRYIERQQQEQAIRRLATVGHSENYIAAATKLSIEQIRRIIGERK